MSTALHYIEIKIKLDNIINKVDLRIEKKKNLGLKT